MPLPFIIGAIAAGAAAAGVGSGIHGAVKMKEANDTAKAAQRRNDENVAKLESNNKKTMQVMDVLGKKELEIISTFEKFSDFFEKIHNRPSFAEINKGNVKFPKFTPKDIKDAGVGASVLLGGLGGAGLGTAGGFAAAGGTTAAVMALGTASTGTAIASLSGAAATNATLAALGGGALAAGGGGVALGTAVLGGATLGVGLLIGGIIFNLAGSSVSDKADRAWNQMRENEEKINLICEYLGKLKTIANDFYTALSEVDDVYEGYLNRFVTVVDYRASISKKVDWNDFNQEEKLITENTMLLVGLLYEMCKVQVVEKSDDENELNEINEADVKKQLKNAEKVLQEIQAA